jgi:ubiquinone biosynthesis protein
MYILLFAIFRAFYIPIVMILFLALPMFFKKSYKARLVKAFELCGPVLIKFGQSISLKPYMFSKETIEACSQLQDQVSSIKMNLKKELGDAYEDFTFQDSKPIASGSIACVFKAKIKKDNSLVAIKILKRNVDKAIKADILLLENTSRILELIPIFKKLKLKAVIQNIKETLLHEINFKNEEENLFKIKSNIFKIYPIAKTPKVFSEYTKENILVTEFIEGIPLSNPQKIKNHNIDINKICKNLIIIYLEQVYEDGFFHADFHPGNLFTDQYGNITMIDFGIVSSITYEERVCLAKILNGFLLKDYKKVFQAHVEGGYIKNTVNEEEFEKDLKKIGESFVHSTNVTQFSISGILMELFKIMEKYQIEIKENLLLLYKTIFFVEAVVTKLNPEYNIWHTIKPWMYNWRDKNLSFVNQIFNQIKKISHLFS